MKPKLTRRDILQLAGGSALGLLLSPLPWKLIDDSAVWTQDWPGVPQPKHGDISYKFTTCSLCSASCGMKLRCVGSPAAAGQQPISAAGISQHPLNSGVICSTGILAHHLRYHPARLKAPVKYLHNSSASNSLSVDEAMREIAAAHGNVVIVDGRPERTASSLYRQIAEKNSAIKYIPLYYAGIDALSTMSGKSIQAGFDIENAKTIVSFGAPLFDGWGSPSRAAKFLDHRQNIIQIESHHSRSAQFASEWIPIHPDTDILFALGMANTIIKENLYDKKAAAGIKDFQKLTNFLSSYSPDVVAEYIGVKAEIIRKTATTFINNTPSIALIGSDSQHPSLEAQAVVMMLNILAGSIGKTGGVLLRQEIPNANENKNSDESIYNLPDHSIRVLILDESLSGSPISNTILQKKLSEDGMILSLSPFATARSFATQYVIPSSVVFETLTDVTGASDRSASSLSISAALLPAPEGTMDAIQFAQRLGQAFGVMIESGTVEELLKKRITSVYQSKRGDVFNASTGQTVEIKSLSSADDLWNTLIAGGCWIDNTALTVRMPEASLMPQLSRITIDSYKQKREQLFVQTERHAYHGNVISPLMSKVRRESKLRQETEL
jgi:hypothetical protein